MSDSLPQSQGQQKVAGGADAIAAALMATPTPISANLPPAANRNVGLAAREYYGGAAAHSSMHEISVIETMSSFLEANGGAELDQNVLRTLAEALSKRVNDTSPGTLQDVTMDNSYSVGYRSPSLQQQPYQNGGSPPAQGRSVREFEEQMATLRKENFNLKLRLYFLEESIPGYQQAAAAGDGQELPLRQLTDAKVEIELLRKEMNEKQNLLKEAALAMTHMEEMQKTAELTAQGQIEELEQKIRYLEMEREIDKSHGDGFMSNLFGEAGLNQNTAALQKIHELELDNRSAEEKLSSLQCQINNLEELLGKRDETIKEYEDKLKELAYQNAELVEANETKCREAENDDLQNVRKDLQQHKIKLADKTCMLQDAEEKLQERNQLYEKACRTIKTLMLQLKEQRHENKRLKNDSAESENNSGADLHVGNNAKDQHANSASALNVERLECPSGFSRSLSDSETPAPAAAQGKERLLETIIAQHEATIGKLKAEVKKKTANLQNLVNKELWEKNREIERLNKLLGETRTALSPDSSTVPTTSANVNMTTATGGSGEQQQQTAHADLELTKALKRSMLLQRKVDVLMQRLAAAQKHEELNVQLQRELQEARADAESAEKWRRECTDVCTVLTNRLEELAGFLNSLLCHKDVLGVLAADRRRAMRKAVDRSLDLSKSLNMTLSMSARLSLADHSLTQLSNLSDILGDNVEGGAENAEQRTFNSHEELQALQSIETLKAENKALKRELDKQRSAALKKDRRSLPLPLDNQSESEAWSEPDRKVSMARIGLEEHAERAAPCSSSAQLGAETDDSESEQGVTNQQQSRTSKTRASNAERIVQLEQLIAQRDERILQIQCQLMEADSLVKQEKQRVLDTKRELEKVRQRNEELQADLMAIGLLEQEQQEEERQQQQAAVSEQSLLSMQRQIEEKTHSLAKIQEERERIATEARRAAMQIDALEQELREMREQHAQALKVAAEQEQRKLAQLRAEMEVCLERRLQEQQRQHEDILARDWIARTLYEESRQQLQELQRQMCEAQRSIEYLNESEQELKASLVESEVAARNYKKQLDESALQASKAVLERTKALNEKLQMEQRLQELLQELQTHESARSKLQQQVMQLLSVQQTLRAELAVKRTTATTTTKNVAIASDASQSGYTSEEVPQVTTSGGVGAAAGGGGGGGAAAATAAQRIENTASPDLGIESDAGGRVSSVELSNAQHMLQKTVELKAASPTSDVKNAKVQNEDTTDDAIIAEIENIKPSPKQEQQQLSAASHGQHDCAKVEQENLELRRKLARTKRAFEDTYEKLRVANQRKAQVEKDIKNQILKTHNLLKNVRSNMESEK